MRGLVVERVITVCSRFVRGVHRTEASAEYLRALDNNCCGLDPVRVCDYNRISTVEGLKAKEKPVKANASYR